MDIPDFSACQRVLSSRWMLPILHVLDGVCRFGEIQEALGGLSRGVLATQLQELREMDLLHQTKYACFPPRVEYYLTEKGGSLLEILDQLPPVAEGETAMEE